MMRCKIALILIVFSVIAGVKGYGEDKISRIDIQGNEIVSDATIISKIKVRAGQPYNKNVVNDDLKNLYGTGFFKTVKVKKQDTAEGVVVIFKVKEKPVLKKITVEGARFIRKKQILEAIDIEEGSFVDEYKLKEAVKKIKGLYNKKGYSQAEVGFELTPRKDKNEAEVAFDINEKGILKVRKVSVAGNESMSTRKIIRLMKTRKAWWLSRGIFKKSTLSDDIQRIGDFYKLQGFSDVAVDVGVEYLPRGVYLTVNVNEGRRYYIGKVNIEGSKDISTAVIIEALKLKEGDLFSEQAIYEGSSRIREVYVDQGYIFSQIDPVSLFNPETEKVDVTYTIIENNIAYIEDIEVKGNVKTKDKIIRRELRTYPGERFDGKKVRKSKERLENLGYFEEIRFGTEPGSESNNVDLVVDVKEAKTGYFSFGGGYSSIDEFVGFVELRQRNFDYRNFSTFTGGGQDLSVTLSLGTLSDRCQLSFTNPWIFDRPVSFGFDGYKKGHDQDENVGYAYAQDIRGGALRLGREFNDYWKGGVAYRFDRVKITDVVSDATQELKDEIGVTDLSSAEGYIVYDSRNNVFSPSRGIYCLNSINLFGGPFGGNRDFVKYFGQINFYFPAVNESVVELKLRTGYGDTYSSTDKIPIYERYFAGGSSTVRGYRERKVGPIDESTEDPIGGEALFVGNIEYTYPLADFLKAATFFDTGEVWKDSSDFLSSQLKSSVGLGFRIKTPIGPVSIDYGWPLDKEPGEEEKDGRFHFNVSRAF